MLARPNPQGPAAYAAPPVGMMRRRTDLGAEAAKTTDAPSAVDKSGDQAFRQHFTDAGGSTPWYIALDIALVVAASAVALGWVLAGASG